MKLCVNTMGSQDMSLEQFAGFVSSLGYPAIEIRGIRGEKDFRKMPDFSKENRKATMDMLKDKGIDLISLNTSCAFHNPDIYARSIEEGKAAIDLAAEIGVPYIRVFGDKMEDPSKYEETLDLVADGIGTVTDYAKGTGVIPVLESHWDFNSLQIFRDLFKRFDSIDFGVLWDIEHTHKVHGGEILEFFGFVRPYLKYLHVKDIVNVDGKWLNTNVGEGVIPIPMIMNLLAASNFDGYLSLEWEKPFQPHLVDDVVAYPQYRDYMRKIFYHI